MYTLHIINTSIWKKYACPHHVQIIKLDKFDSYLRFFLRVDFLYVLDIQIFSIFNEKMFTS